MTEQPNIHDAVDDDARLDHDAELLQWILADQDVMLRCYCEVSELDMPLRRPGSDDDPRDAVDWSLARAAAPGVAAATSHPERPGGAAQRPGADRGADAAARRARDMTTRMDVA